MARKLLTYDTTLRDGSQSCGISYSLTDKLNITQLLDSFGIDYIEGGWPGSNPKDEDYFKQVVKLNLQHSKIVAFGSTRKKNCRAKDDRQLTSLINTNAKVICIVAKSWPLHVSKVLQTSLQENLAMIKDTIDYLKSFNRQVILDLEHFFDSYQQDPDYAIRCIETATNSQVDSITLCDTNGGKTPQEIFQCVSQIKQKFPDVLLGIHCHNDCELAVANSLQAVYAGVNLIQGTINGYGERCGNANLVSLIPTLLLKDKIPFNYQYDLTQLSLIAQQVADITNIPLSNNAAYVGNNAFTHKGGIHVAAVTKIAASYEHIPPELVGNGRKVTISELSGKANITHQAQQLGFDVDHLSEQVLVEVKQLEQAGIHLENAQGSFEILLRSKLSGYQKPFTLLKALTVCESGKQGSDISTACVKIKIHDQVSQVVAEANGPIDAFNIAFKKSLAEFYPQVSKFNLLDYKVSIINPETATAATTRVWVQASANNQRWSTIGCSDNILNASIQALVESYELFLHKFSEQEAIL